MAHSILYPELRQLLDEGAQLVEVLPPEEYAEEHLPGAMNIPLKALDADTTAGLDKTKAIVVIWSQCTGRFVLHAARPVRHCTDSTPSGYAPAMRQGPAR